MYKLVKRCAGLLSVMLIAGLVLSPARVLSENHFSDSQIDSFVRAQTEIMQLEQRYSAEFAEAETEMEQQMVMQEANEKMMNVIESEEIDLDMFNEIATHAQEDPDLQGRLKNAMQELMMQ